MTRPVAEASAFLRWAGSKRKLLPILAAHVNEKFDRYVEPFAGSACLFFALKPKKALIGDINSDLIKTYLEVKYRVENLISELGGMAKSKDVYLTLRSLDPNGLSPAMRAARFIYLNRNCFNGLYRTNRDGQFNVPYGGERSGELPSPDSLRACSRALQAARLIATDFESLLDQTNKGDFVYIDPPFSVRASRMFSEYDASIFDFASVQRLRNSLVKLRQRNIPFLVSYADSEEAEFLQEGFLSEKVSVRRNIAGFAASRKVISEVLIYN